MPDDNQSTNIVVIVLNEWARWLIRGNGYARRSSIAILLDGGIGGQGFRSTTPSGSIPNTTAEKASKAMMHLRDMEPRLAGVLESWYLRDRNKKMPVLAKEMGLNVNQYRKYRRKAEMKFGEIFDELFYQD